MKQPFNISIVGGEISGIVTALALLKRGFGVQIYEQTQALRDLGIGLTLTPSGLRQLEGIQPGIANLLKQAGREVNRLTLKCHTGTTIASRLISKHNGQPQLNIQGSRLQAMLASALPSNAILFQHRCVGYEPLADQVKLFFAHGKTVETDLLIGADGINSVVRQTLIGDGCPNFVDRVSWQAVVPFTHPQLSPNTSLLFTASDSKTFLLADAGEGYAFWSASACSTDDLVNQRATTAKIRVLQRFIDWADPVSAIVAATPEEAIVECPICDRAPLSQWSQESVTLVGDAAHPAHPIIPMLEHGVNSAFMDADQLAACLAASSDVETALKAYDRCRMSRAAVISDRTHR